MSLIVEYLFLIFLLLGGYAFLRSFGVPRTVNIVFAFMTGACIFIAIVYIQFVTFIPTYPVLSISIFVFATIALFVISRQYQSISKIELLSITICCLAILGIVLLLNNFSLVKYHYDSLRYLIVSSLISSDNFDSITTNLLKKRLSSFSILNAPAHLGRSFYFPSLVPVFGINLLVVMFYIAFAGVWRSTQTWGAYLVASASTILLLSINRTVWNGFYLNNHTIEALCLLTVVGAGWLGALRALPLQTTLVLQAVATIGVVTSRPEGFIMAGLALLPSLLSGDVPKKNRILLACVWALSIAFQQATVLLAYMDLSKRLPHVALRPFILSLAILASTPVLLFNWIARHAYGILVAVELGLWLMLAFYVSTGSKTFHKSVQATLENVVYNEGGWGVSIVVLAVLIAVAVIFTNAPQRIFIRFPLTSFIPVAFILTYIRGGPYRIGEYDSLNRMIFHILPIAILFVASASTSAHFGLRAWKGVFWPWPSISHFQAARMRRLRSRLFPASR